MKFTITTSHYQYLRDNQMLVIDEFITPDQSHALSVGIDEAFTHRLGEGWDEKDPYILFTEGYNLHYDSDALRRVLSKRHIALVISELLDCKPLRLGYSQYLPENKERDRGVLDPYGEFLKGAGSLKKNSCIQGTIAGLMLCVKEPDIADSEGFYPATLGQAVLFKNDKQFNRNYLNEQNGGAYLLATYTEDIALYVRNDRDPHLHFFKKLGRNFGDKIREPGHPVILR